MPKVQQKAPRQKPVSCTFCRVRKLKCSRDLPCSNCLARGVSCDWEPPNVQTATGSSSTDSQILQRLDRLESLLLNHKASQERPLLPITPETVNHSTASTPTPTLDQSNATLSPQVQHLADEVAELQRIYTGRGLPGSSVLSSQYVIQICPLKEIPLAQMYFTRPNCTPNTLSSHIRCFWLPQYDEVLTLLEKYLRDIEHFFHVMHIPSLRILVAEVYTKLNQHNTVSCGSVLLIISIIASATHSWSFSDYDSRLSLTGTEVRAQTPIWIKSSEDLLDIAYRVDISTEVIHALINVSFVLANMEGFSRRCRSLFSTGLFVAKELGLHLIDHPKNADAANTIQAEVGRRTWWYMCTSDWAMAARFDGKAERTYSCHPRQMITKKPLNINDADLFDGMSRTERPVDAPTEMTYQLTRIRIGEVSRTIIDRTPLMFAGEVGQDVIMDLDTELQTILDEMPPCFRMSKQEIMTTYSISPEAADKCVYQAHLAHFFAHGQRLKLHLPYFTKAFVDTRYSLSRDICQKSARAIIRSETSFNHTSPSNSATERSSPFKFTGVLLGILIATVVLLMEFCINRSALESEEKRAVVSDAMKIIQAARKESEAADRFVNELTTIMCKHIMNSSGKNDDGFDLQPTVQRINLLDRTKTPMLNNITDARTEAEQVFQGEDLSIYFDEFTQNLEQGIDLNDFDWDDIFSDLRSTFV